jgi:hypothetical protein
MTETNLVEPQHAGALSLLERLEQHFQRHAVLSPGLPLVLALWSLATYMFESFDCFPYLAVTSPTKRCGKTRVAELLEFVCANPLRTVGITPAALFRTIEKKKPTLLIDEAEALRGRDERATALREILNAGYRKGQKVIRCEGGNGNSYKTREFETFCPKVLVLIGDLSETLADRCLPVQMKRRTSERLERFRFARVKVETGPLRVEAKQWAKKNRLAVERWYQANDVTCVEDREAELWLPLFAVCTLAAPERLSELESIARQLSGTKAASEPADFGTKLLVDLRAIFGTDRETTANLLSRLNGLSESPWPNWSNGRGLDGRFLSRLLRPFGIQPRNIRLGETVAKGYEKSDFEDAWSRYLLPVSATAATKLSSQQDGQDSASATRSACSASENAENANVYAGCSGVADETLPSPVVSSTVGVYDASQ